MEKVFGKSKLIFTSVFEFLIHYLTLWHELRVQLEFQVAILVVELISFYKLFAQTVFNG